MALLTVQDPILTGEEISYASASTSDTFTNTGNEIIIVKSGSGASATLTVNSITACSYGDDHNITLSVAASKEYIIGPFNPARFNDSTGVTTITLTSATDISYAVVSR